MTYVRTRLALDRLAEGEVLQVRLRGDDPRRQVPASAVRQGHTIISESIDEDGECTLLIRKGAAPPSPRGRPGSLRPVT